MPNHVMFQIGKDMPQTMNELRDSCRNNMTSVIMKYADEIVKLVNEKVQRAKTKQINTHVKFEESQSKVAKKRKDSSESSESSSSSEEEQSAKEDEEMRNEE